MVYINTGKSYEHYNSSMGKQIRSKRHYEEEMKKGGYISFEESAEIARNAKEKRQKPYVRSQKANEIMESCKQRADKNGNLKMPERAIEGLEKMGMTFDADKINKHIEES